MTFCSICSRILVKWRHFRDPPPPYTPRSECEESDCKSDSDSNLKPMEETRTVEFTEKELLAAVTCRYSPSSHPHSPRVSPTVRWPFVDLMRINENPSVDRDPYPGSPPTPMESHKSSCSDPDEKVPLSAGSWARLQRSQQHELPQALNDGNDDEANAWLSPRARSGPGSTTNREFRTRHVHSRSQQLPLPEPPRVEAMRPHSAPPPGKLWSEAVRTHSMPPPGLSRSDAIRVSPKLRKQQSHSVALRPGSSMTLDEQRCLSFENRTPQELIPMCSSGSESAKPSLIAQYSRIGPSRQPSSASSCAAEILDTAWDEESPPSIDAVIAQQAGVTLWRRD